MSLRGLQEDELSYAASSTGGDRLPPQVWSTLRIGLDVAIQWRAATDRPRIGAAPLFAESQVVRQPERGETHRLCALDYLATCNPDAGSKRPRKSPF